jgi:hypothetical protein
MPAQSLSSGFPIAYHPDEADLRRFHAMDENLKAQLFPPLVVFNLTVGSYMLVRFFTSKHMSYGALFTHLLVGAAAGLVLAGITFFFTRKK